MHLCIHTSISIRLQLKPQCTIKHLGYFNYILAVSVGVSLITGLEYGIEWQLEWKVEWSSELQLSRVFFALFNLV